MAAAAGGKILGGVRAAYRWNIGCNAQPGTLFQVRNYAARKGTREKARKAKVKVVEKKVVFVPHNLRVQDKLKLHHVNKRIDDSWKQESSDNVWVAKYYKWRVYPFEEAVKCHWETHHPTMYNIPNAPLNALIELDMQGAKKTRFVDNFTRMVSIPHPFDHGEDRTVLALCKTQELQQLARNAGAALVGGPELIKDIQSGEVPLSEYQHVIAHPNILPELVSVRGLMKRKFPNPKSGSLGPDVAELVKKYVHGIQYTATKDERQQDFGRIEVTIGTLEMDPKHLEENFASLLHDVNSMAPKREGPFITKTLLTCAPSVEQLKIDHEQYIESKSNSSENADDEDEDEQQTAAAAI